MVSDARSQAREYFEAAGELTIRLHVLDESRPNMRLSANARAFRPGDDIRDIRAAHSLGDMDGSDITAVAFIVMLEASKSAREDLKAIVEGLKATSAAKARLCKVLRCVGESDDTQSRLEDLDTVFEILLAAYAIELDQAREQLVDRFDSLGEMGEMESLRLQMAMDRLSKLMSTLSNLLKKSSETAQGITQNMK